MKKINKFTALWLLIIGLLLCVGPFHIFDVCPTTEKIMKCYWSCRAEIAMGIMVIIIGLLVLFTKKKETLIILQGLAAIVSALAVSIPAFLIGGCSSTAMRCRMITFPMIYIIGLASFIVMLIMLLISIKVKENN